MTTTERTFIKMPAALTTAIKEKCVQFKDDEFSLQLDCKRQFTALEEKVFLAMLQTGFEFCRIDNDIKTVRVYFSNIRAMFPTLSGYTNDELSAAANAFYESSIKITVPSSGAQEKKVFDEKLGEFIYAKFHLITGMIRFADGIEYTFNDDLLNIIFGDKAFAKLPLQDLNAIGGSAYALPLYGFSKRYENVHKTKQISLIFLRQLLGVPDESYKEFKHFKQKVLDRIIKEINKKTSISIVPKTIKGGKKVIGIYFEVRKKSVKSTSENGISAKAKKLKETLIPEDSPEIFGIIEESVDHKVIQITPFVERAFATMSRGKDDNYRQKIEKAFLEGDERTINNVFNRILEHFDIDEAELQKTVNEHSKNYFSSEAKILGTFYRKDGMVVIEEENLMTKKKEFLEIDYKKFVEIFGRGKFNESFQALEEKRSKKHYSSIYKRVHTNCA